MNEYKQRIAAAIQHYYDHNAGNPSYTIPARAGGSNVEGQELLNIFCDANGISQEVVPPKKLTDWRNKLADIAQEWKATPDQAKTALTALFDPNEELGWKSFQDPRQKSFVEGFGLMLGRVLTSGTTAGGKGPKAREVEWLS